jgi:NADP-dependent 3-hydroxy acid dehydrogenase YdfG
VSELLADRIAVVTGAGGGIGAAISPRFAEEGARVVVVDIDPTRANSVATAVQGIAVVADVQTPDGVAAAIAAADDLGGVDILVNNVGHFLFARHDFKDSTPDEWDALHRINLLHVLGMTRAALPGMVERDRGARL